MRRPSLLLILAFLIACTTTPKPSPARPSQPVVRESQGLTVEEEAVILRLEDRREFDPALAESWIRHPNAQHRARMALALGRIEIGRAHV